MNIITVLRNNTWVIPTLIGVGMVGFILQDSLNSKTGGIFFNSDSVGNIAGRDVSQKEFYNLEKELFDGKQGGNSFEQRDQLWNYLISTTLIDKSAEKLGLGVGKTEMDDLMTGANMSPVVRQEFSQNGQMNTEVLGQFVQLYKGNRSTLQPEQKKYFEKLENRVRIDALQQKMIAMAQNAIYTPKWMIDMEQARSTPVDFKFVPVPYALVKDDEVKVTDADLKAYIAAHSKLFTNDEEVRTVAYAAIMVAPSAADSAVVLKDMQAQTEGLRAASGEKGDSTYCANNYGDFKGVFLNKAGISGVSPKIADSVFKVPVGTVIGPFAEAGVFRTAKLVVRQSFADSAKARHILIQPSQTLTEAQVKTKIDSIKGLIEKGAMRFDSAAIKMSADKGSAIKGGELATVGFGAYVPEFNKVVFETGAIGKLYVVKTQFGYHLIEVLSRKGASDRVKIAYLTKPIVPSKETEGNAYRKATELAQKNRTVEALEKAAKADKTMAFQLVPNVKINDYQAQGLESGDVSRNVIKWAFDNSEGNVSPEVYGYIDPVNQYTNRYVVAGVKSRTPKGLATVDDVREAVATKVRNEKKAELIKAKIGTVTTLESVIAKYAGLEVKDAAGVTMNSPFVPGLGNEPKAIAAVLGTAVNKVSKPIVGNEGVFVVMPTNKPAAQPVADYKMARMQMDAQIKQGTPQGYMNAIRKNAVITDTRYKFF